MLPPVQELEMLSRQINQAHRSAVQAELNAAGLGEVGHPMLLTILQGSFTMVMAVDVSKSSASVGELRGLLEALGEKMEISIRIQREEIFDAMHRI